MTLTLAAAPSARASEFSLEETIALAPSHLLTLSPALANAQATNLRVRDQVAFVTYNTAGPGSAGAFEAIDISDIKHPRPLGLITYRQFEFADLALVGNSAYIVGQEATPAHTGAVLRQIDITDPSHLVDGYILPLPGHAATSIQVQDGTALVSTGDDGFIEQIDISGFFPILSPSPIPFANALFVGADGDHYYVLGGANGTSFTSYRACTLAQAKTVELSAQTTASPARFQIQGNTAYINAETLGLSIVDLGSFKKIGQVAVPGTGNGIDLHGSHAFLAQGEAGIYVVDVKDKKNPKVIGSVATLPGGGSANQVKFYRTPGWFGSANDSNCPIFGDEYLLVAGGKAGLLTYRIHE